eukprot:6322203-Prorocentrum_lima.AAC.1
MSTPSSPLIGGGADASKVGLLSGRALNVWWFRLSRTGCRIQVRCQTPFVLVRVPLVLRLVTSLN